MGRKAKFSFEIKIDTVLRCLKGETTASHEAMRLGINSSRVLEWITLYQHLGEKGLITTSKNTHYSSDTKTNAVLDYLNGKGSYSTICKKYGIRSSCQLRNWILKYNGHEKLKASGTGGTPIVTKGRKTTFDERIEIVQYCISHTHNYAETAEKFNISYQRTDNGPMEGFGGILKREMYYKKKFHTREDLVQAITDYMDYYSNNRPQRGLGILTSMEYHKKQLLAA